MAELTVEQITTDGLDPTLVAAEAGGDTFSQPNADVFLYVNNADTASKQVTVTAETTEKEVSNWGTLSASDVVVSVPGGEFRLIGPFPRGPYTTNPAITYDDVTDLTIGAIQLPK